MDTTSGWYVFPHSICWPGSSTSRAQPCPHQPSPHLALLRVQFRVESGSSFPSGHDKRLQALPVAGVGGIEPRLRVWIGGFGFRIVRSYFWQAALHGPEIDGHRCLPVAHERPHVRGSRWRADPSQGTLVGITGSRIQGFRACGSRFT